MDDEILSDVGAKALAQLMEARASCSTTLKTLKVGHCEIGPCGLNALRDQSAISRCVWHIATHTY